jgi:hypothetical protein
LKWARAVHHVESLAQSCAERAEPSPFYPFRVTQLWVVGDILGPPRDLEWVTVALAVDLPVADVAWWTEPVGARHWTNATRLDKNPIQVWWRSAYAPVWNHRIQRPALIWDDELGVRQETLDAISAGNGEAVRQAPPAEDELRARLRDELKVSLQTLQTCTQAFEERRWKPGKIEPVADALWRASDGYLDVLKAVHPDLA